MPLKTKEVVLALPTAVAPVTPSPPSPISAKAIAPVPEALLIDNESRACVPPIVPPTLTAPDPVEIVRALFSPNWLLTVDPKRMSLFVVVSVMPELI